LGNRKNFTFNFLDAQVHLVRAIGKDPQGEDFFGHETNFPFPIAFLNAHQQQQSRPDPADYFTGVGTKNAAAVFAQNGYATLAPDFLGYGQSDPPAADTIAARLEKPKHILDLLASLKSLPVIDPARVGLWAHSNGGQIALSVLEITGQAIPTTLWAPVSKSFPYAILYYTDESDDQGKELRRVLAEFEKDYDTFDFSIDRYWDWIQAPVQVHQGTADDAVPLEWSAGLVNILKKTDPEVTLYTYPGADHNLRPDWDTAVARDLQFFDQSLLH